MTKNAKSTPGTSGAFRTLAVDTYNAFIEWPVWLVLRGHELDKHLAISDSTVQAAPPSAQGAPHGGRSPEIPPAAAAPSAPSTRPKASAASSSKLGQRLVLPDALAPVKMALTTAPETANPAVTPGTATEGVAQDAEASAALGDFLSDF